MNNIYTWVAAYKKIANKLAEYEFKRSELIGILKFLGIDKLTDRDKDHTSIDLEDIDPFTFLSYLNKYGDDRRITIVNALSAYWCLEENILDVCGLPTSNPRRVWLFPYKFERSLDEIDHLWKFYHSVMNDTVSNEELRHIKTIKSVGWSKISEGMFYLKPDTYLPLNGVVTPYLTSLGIQVNNQSIEGIKFTGQQVKEIILKPFFQISYEGWLYIEQTKKQPKYWRIGIKDGDNGVNFLSDMLSHNVVCIGWGNLGDLRKIEPLNKTTIQKLLVEQIYGLTKKQVAGRKAGEIIDFVRSITYNDYVVAMDGQQVKAVGRMLHNEYFFMPDQGFPHARVVEWLKIDITGVSISEGLRTTVFPIKNSKNISEINRLLDMSTKPIIDTASDSNYDHINPLNQILYGPPGTGKTYNSIDKAVQIATGSSASHEENKLAFDRLRDEGQIEFVTFHQGYSYEDFMVGIRPNIDTEHLTFRPYKGIFYRMVERAKENYLASTNKRSMLRSFDDVFEEFIAPLEKQQPVEVEMVSGVKFSITDVENGTIRFKKSNGSNTHTLSVETLKGIVDGKRDFHSGLGSYYKPLVAYLIGKKRTEDPTAELKKFVIIIDEINRANISKVFGELITLLEDDKRLGAENSLAVTLPNGELNFCIPPNLYIVGTMNTADKSISLIDVALRRRFDFQAYYPDYSILHESYSDRIEILQKINEAIFNRKKTADYLIGQGYFMKPESIERILKNKIIPLLMEYFSGRIDEVESVLSEASIDGKYDLVNYSWHVGLKDAVSYESGND